MHYTVFTLHLHAGCMRDETEVLKEPCLDLVEVVQVVLVRHVCRTDVQFKVRPKVLKVIVVRQFCVVGRAVACKHW